MAITAQPIKCVGNSNPGNPAPVSEGNIGEAASLTFKQGTPIAMGTGGTAGYYIAWAGTDPAGAPSILGISDQFGQNLTTNGVQKPGSFGSVQNQSAALNLYYSGPVSPSGVGGCGIPFPVWGKGNRFTAVFGNAGAAATPALSDVGKFYGLTLDTGGNYWYVDKSKATQGTNTAVRVVDIDPATSANGANITANTLVIFEADPATSEL